LPENFNLIKELKLRDWRKY